MAKINDWTTEQRLVAFSLYCQLTFGKLHARNPTIIKYAKIIGRTPNALAMKLSNIASLDPEITSTGRSGLDGSSIADRAMWAKMQNDWQGFAEEAQQAINNFGISELSLDDNQANAPINYTGHTKPVQTQARIGQNLFRRSVLSAYQNQCCITGLSVTELLVASHIIPWSIDPKNRLNPHNGLCLSVLHDKAFDLGIITINENMTIRVSDQYPLQDAFFTATLRTFNGKPIHTPNKFRPHADFLAYHREHIFESRCVG